MIICLFCFFSAKEYILLKHFLRYYYDFLEIRNFHMILHSVINDTNRQECINILEYYDIE